MNSVPALVTSSLEASLGAEPGDQLRRNLVLSAVVGTSADVFPMILRLHVPAWAQVVDLSFGRGVFWGNLAQQYRLISSDLLPLPRLSLRADFRHLPFRNCSVDAIVHDPPYTSRDGGPLRGISARFENAYRNVASLGISGGHNSIIRMYETVLIEGWRVLRPGGHLIFKCQDEVCGGRAYWTHVELIRKATDRGYFAVDLFILVRRGTPVISHAAAQRHARKNHSYFLVFRKPLRCRRKKPSYTDQVS